MFWFEGPLRGGLQKTSFCRILVFVFLRRGGLQRTWILGCLLHVITRRTTTSKRQRAIRDILRGLQ